MSFRRACEEKSTQIIVCQRTLQWISRSFFAKPGLEVINERQIQPATLDPEAAILAYVRTHGRITRRQAMSLTMLSENQVRYHLRKLVERGELELIGTGRGASYRRPAPKMENKR